jgi:hypothetical protein
VTATFGLTPAETRVLASLFAGHTLNETDRNARHHQADGEKPPGTHLPEDQGDAPGRAHAFVDGADLPDRIEYVIAHVPLPPWRLGGTVGTSRPTPGARRWPGERLSVM